MRKETAYISERDLMFTIAGQLYDQAPNRKPRNADIIMQKVQEAFRKVAHNNNEHYSYRAEDIQAFIHTLLFSIPEFVDLNLTQNEFEAGIKVDDENRGKYKFTSLYDVETVDSWRNDFIDLDAFEGNILYRLYMLQKRDEDCFGCVNENTEVCNSCITNPKFDYHYNCRRTPKGNYTFACKYDCPKSYYICCEECNKSSNCPHKCQSCSSTCGLKV